MLPEIERCFQVVADGIHCIPACMLHAQCHESLQQLAEACSCQVGTVPVAGGSVYSQGL